MELLTTVNNSKKIKLYAKRDIKNLSFHLRVSWNYPLAPSVLDLTRFSRVPTHTVYKIPRVSTAN